MLGIVVIVIAIVMIGTIVIVEHVRGFSAFVDVLILGVRARRSPRCRKGCRRS
jgi:Ca2+-transporting ATPase